MPSLRELRQRLKECELERDRLANRIRLQRTRPLPASLSDDLDPDEQAMIMAACAESLGRAEAALALAAREVEAHELEAARGGLHPAGEQPSLRSGMVFLGACLALIAVMQVLAGSEPSTGTLAAIGSGCLLYAIIMRLCPNARAEFVFAGACLVLLAGLHALSGLSPSIGGLAIGAAASLLYGFVSRAGA